MISEGKLHGLGGVRDAIADVNSAKSVYFEFSDTGLSELSSFQRFILSENDNLLDIFDSFFEKATKQSKYDTEQVEFLRSDANRILEFNSKGPPYVKVKIFFVDDTYVKLAKWLKKKFFRQSS